MNASEQLRREVYGLLGVPIDVADMATALLQIRKAASDPSPFLISTVNLNFLISSQTDPEFRESLLMSDLCTADGMPIIWLGRLLGVPLKERIAGADIFDKLRTTKIVGNRLKIFLFGGDEGIAAAACKKLNTEPTEVTCVGFLYPGFGAVDDMSAPETIETINRSGANFLAVALGAQKGQPWLRRNHARLRIPVRVHLGAAINFQAGTLKRAPMVMQSLGLEWLWRIKEEPQLWPRYWNDGLAFLALLTTHVFPLLLVGFWGRLTARRLGEDLRITSTDDHDSVIINLDGIATAKTVEKAAVLFESAGGKSKDVVVNFTNTRQIDARFLGLILMLDKYLKKQGHQLRLLGTSPRMEKLFRLNGFEFLLRPATK
jgi:N-acetylglucosaminyldiphosphoundecaprenol N-acetyl-beta-D-mannosaminyltransferase